MIKVHISSATGFNRWTNVWFVDEYGYGLANSQSVGRIVDGVIIFEPTRADGDDPPTLRLDSRSAHSLFKALAEALSGEGIRTDSDAKLHGTLEATRAHLADMRELLGLGEVKA